jgi:hypothetical protein
MNGEVGPSLPEETVDLDLGPLDLRNPPIVEGPARAVEKTRATLAYCLFGLLAAVVGVILGLLAAGTLSPTEFDNIAGVLIAPIVGLLGAATGYYYGRGDK